MYTFPEFLSTRNDAFVTKINPAGSALVFSTYLGGTKDDYGQSIVVDTSGQIYIGGATSSPDFPVANASQPALGGGYDMFFTIMKADGSGLASSTYFGGTGNESIASGATLALSGLNRSASSLSNYDVTTGNAKGLLCGDGEKPSGTNTKDDPICLIFQAQADIAITKVEYGKLRDYEIGITFVNNGPDTATNVKVNYTATLWNPDCCNPGVQPEMAVGKSVTFYLRDINLRNLAQAPPQGASLHVEVGADQTDPAPSNNVIDISFYDGKFLVTGKSSADWLTWTYNQNPNTAWGSVTLSPSSKLQVTPKVSGVPSVPAALAIFGLTENNVLVTEAGVPAASPVTSARMFVDAAGGANSGVAIVNPNAGAISVNVQARDISGSLVSSGTVTVAPSGHVAEFPGDMGLSLPQNFLGTLTLSSANIFGVVNLRVASNVYGEPIFSALPLADLNNPSTASSLVLPQIVDGGGIPTRILLMNTSATITATGSISLFDDNGNPLTLDFGSAGKQSQLSYSLPPNGVAKFSTTGLGQLKAGYALVAAQSGPLPVGSAIFAANNATGIVSEAGVLAAPATTSARMYAAVSSSDVTRNTGMALVNPSATAATVNISLVDNLTDQVRTATISLPPHGHTAKFVTDLFPDVPTDSFQGTLTLTSNVAVAAVALRVTTNQRGDVLFSTLPVADLNNPPAGPEYLPQIVNGGGYSTELILISTSSGDSNVQINFFNDAGAPVTSPFP
ncbi:MAG TPA: SBBP repeat-containing protein [Terriglobia bacterium]|nr:SBBP repeat-containing protein [Terriglobia bacterium]